MAAALTPSQIAAQTAMLIQNQQHNRKRSQTLPDPSAPTPPQSGRQTPASPAQRPQVNMPSNPNLRNYDGFIGGHTLAAQTAANAVFPRSPGQASPSLPPERFPPPVPEKDLKKEKSKMKLFHKPKSIGIYKEKDVDKKYALPSPNKSILSSSSALAKLQNPSSTSLVDSTMSSASSIYSSNNASTSTLVPAIYEKESQKKHHFLSRQKNKLKDDHFNLPLSSAASTSKPTDPSAPKPLYSFAAPPSSPSHSTFAKSVSGLDLRHGGRALREKKKEDKSSLAPVLSNSSTHLEPAFRSRDDSFSGVSEWNGPSSVSSTAIFGPPSGTSDQPLSLTQTGVNGPNDVWGVPSISVEDAWHYVKAHALKIFEGQVPRPPIEDFNDLVSTELKRCIRLRQPLTMIEELNELLEIGFTSLEHTLRGIPDTQLVPHLVHLWDMVFSSVLPFMQAVFNPLDLEFKGRGPLMTAREAAEFWGAALPSSDDAATNKNIPTLGEDLDVRRITLLKFRDIVILPRNDALMAIFSRLSLESINAGVMIDPLPEPPPLGGGGGSRPGTATSTESGPGGGPSQSYTSQSSTLLDTASPFTAASRSRATSNTSAGSFGSGSRATPPPAHAPPATAPSSTATNPARWLDSSKVTDMVGKMLQCVSVVASVQSGDDAQAAMDALTKALKYNWLGRGRTGRQRRGFVGMRVGRPLGAGGVLGGAEGVGVAG